MKKVLSLLAIVMLLMPMAGAMAETPMTIRYLPSPSKYSMAEYLPLEVYPEVCLIPYNAYESFGDKYNGLSFLCFPSPEGALPEEIGNNCVHYLDAINKIQYSYQLFDNRPYEVFLKNVEKQYILLDGKNGTAAYIDPKFNDAYGMFNARAMGNTAKLYIRVSLDYLKNEESQSVRVQTLSDAIMNEIERVKGQMHKERKGLYWSEDRFSGIKFLVDNDKKLCRFVFPARTDVVDGAEVTASFIVTDVDRRDVKGVYSYKSGEYVDVQIYLDTLPYPLVMEKEGKPVRRETLSSGRTWTYYIANEETDGRIFSWYATTLLTGIKEYEKQLYITIEMRATMSHIRWDDEDACLRELAQWDAGISVVNAASDPYIAPPEETAQEAPVEEAPAEDAPVEEAPAATDAAAVAETQELWVCPQCGKENAGNFCGDCGTARPVESAVWTCPQCGQKNESNFCTNCGTAKP